MPLEAVIFDLDGTLVDTEPTYRAAWRQTFQGIGIELTDADLDAVMGLKPDESAALMLERHSAVASADALAEHTLRAVLADPVRQLQLGATHAIELALKLGYKIAIATGSPTNAAQMSLKNSRLDGYFDVVASTEDERYGLGDCRSGTRLAVRSRSWTPRLSLTGQS